MRRRSSGVHSAGGPLRVVVVGPPLDASGGIGRLMGYLRAALPDSSCDLRFLDTRGRSVSPWGSIIPVLKTCVALLLLRLVRRVDVIHINVSVGASTVRKAIVRIFCLGLPTVLHLHADDYEGFLAPLPTSVRSLTERFFRSVDVVIVLGAVWMRYVVESLHVPSERVRIVFNSVPEFSASAEGPKPAGREFRLLFLGRLGDRKGVP